MGRGVLDEKIWRYGCAVEGARDELMQGGGLGSIGECIVCDCDIWDGKGETVLVL